MKNLEPNQPSRILIVEDEPVIATALKQRLVALGYEVCGMALAGEEAIELAGRTSPDLVLMDIRLEGDMEGTDAAASIRSSFKVPIVFVTAHADEEILQKAKQSDPFGYLVKPYSRRELRTTIEVALYKARAEKMIVRAKEEWENTFDAVPDLILLLDTDYRILRANKAAVSRLGMTSEEMVGRKCFECFHAEKAPPEHCPHARLLSDGKPHFGEITENRLGAVFEVGVWPLRDAEGRTWGAVDVARDITERKHAEAERERLILELQQALAEVKTLSGLLPICASCKKIRDDQGYWQQIEAYISDHSHAEFTHSICPDCAKKLYPGFYEK